MNIDPSALLQLLTGILLGIIGFMGKKALQRLDSIEDSTRDIDRALIRLDARFTEHLKETPHA